MESGNQYEGLDFMSVEGLGILMEQYPNAGPIVVESYVSIITELVDRYRLITQDIGPITHDDIHSAKRVFKVTDSVCLEAAVTSIIESLPEDLIPEFLLCVGEVEMSILAQQEGVVNLPDSLSGMGWFLHHIPEILNQRNIDSSLVHQQVVLDEKGPTSLLNGTQGIDEWDWLDNYRRRKDLQPGLLTDWDAFEGLTPDDIRALVIAKWGKLDPALVPGTLAHLEERRRILEQEGQQYLDRPLPAARERKDIGLEWKKELDGLPSDFKTRGRNIDISS